MTRRIKGKSYEDYEYKSRKYLFSKREVWLCPLHEPVFWLVTPMFTKRLSDGWCERCDQERNELYPTLF